MFTYERGISRKDRSVGREIIRNQEMFTSRGFTMSEFSMKFGVNCTFIAKTNLSIDRDYLENSNYCNT